VDRSPQNEESFFLDLGHCHVIAEEFNDARFFVSGLFGLVLVRYPWEGTQYRLGMGGTGRIGLGFFHVYMDDISDTINDTWMRNVKKLRPHKLLTLSSL
jgi:hypothetical protein